jgi:hypothetical protein
MRLVRRRPRAAAVAGAAAAVLLAGCGGDGGAAGPLAWKADPILQPASERLPDDLLLTGTVRNVSIREELDIDAAKVVVRDAAGKPLKAFAAFTFTYAHGIYGNSEAPNGPVASDRERLGLRRKLKPGQESPLTVAFRLTKSTKLPLVVDYGEGELTVPESPAGD